MRRGYPNCICLLQQYLRLEVVLTKIVLYIYRLCSYYLDFYFLVVGEIVIPAVKLGHLLYAYHCVKDTPISRITSHTIVAVFARNVANNLKYYGNMSLFELNYLNPSSYNFYLWLKIILFGKSKS